MTQERSELDYFGRLVTATHPTKKIPVTNFFTFLGTIHLFNDRLFLEFPDYTLESFRSYGERLGLFTQQETLTPDEFASFYAANQPIVDGIKQLGRAYCNAPLDAEFRYFKLSAEFRTLEILFHLGGEDFPKNFYSETYNNLVIADVTAATAEQPSMTETVAAKAFELAAIRKPEFWANSVPVN